MAAKREFEEKCAHRGIKVQHYHAENGRFAEPTWKEDCKLQQQKLTFCGVGAHHQNAIVERKIKDLTLTARTLLLHAMRYWPEYITQILWPFALKCAEDRLNNLHVDIDGQTAEMRFSKSPTASVDLRNFHSFGCPCYILDARVQGNPKGLPKWEPRARLGIYLGHSPAHAGSVALVMNPKTGLVSPQFHVVFDDTFSTVPHIRSGTVPSNWAQLVRDSSKLVTDQEYDLTRTWFEGVQDPSAGTETEDISEDISNNNQNESTNAALPQTATGINSTDSEGGHETDSSPVSEGDEELRMPKMVNLQESGLQRSPRLNARKALTTLLTVCFSALL